MIPLEQGTDMALKDITMPKKRTMATINRRLIGVCFCTSTLFVMLTMMYMLGNSSDSLGTVTYYAAHMDTIIHNVWIEIKASYNLPRNKHLKKNQILSEEIASCISTHQVNQTFISKQEEIQESRKAALRNACQKYFEPTNGPHVPARAYVLDEYQLVYAQSAKIASTSWNRVLLVLSHFANATNSYSQSKTSDRAKVRIPTLNTYLNKDRDLVLRNFTTFMFSRHPFSRLLSAYSCKVGPDATEEHIKRGFFDRLRQKILKKYPTTIHYKKGIPDFRGFVSYILDTNFFSDPHWKENYKVVAPCDVPYDVIGRFETLEEDAKYILQSVGADCFVEFPTSKGSAATNSSHDEILNEHYQTLSKDLIHKLYDRYRLDFLLFGYTFEINIDGQLLRFPPK